MSDWHMMLGFLGNAPISAANAEALLDDWLTSDPVTVLFPDTIPMDGGLRVVRDLFRDWEDEYASGRSPRRVDMARKPADRIVGALAESTDDGYQPYLVVLLGEGEESVVEQCRAALKLGIPVKALDQALDDVAEDDEPDHPMWRDEPRELSEDEQRRWQEARIYGKPRAEPETVVANVAGPATIVEQTPEHPLVTAVREIVREEVMYILGHQAHVAPLLNESLPAQPEEEEKQAVWQGLDEDGVTIYQRPTGKRAPRGWKTVWLTQADIDSVL